MNPGRRRALRVLAGTGAATAVAASPVSAARAPGVVSPEAVGMLYDTTKCIGCKACVSACLRANDLEPDRSPDGLHQAPLSLNSRTKNVIKLYKDDQQTSYFKMQCMHCVDPACASACMLGSLRKDETTGIVSYDPSYCVGCRYCQMACPFNVAKFEFEKAAPKIVKCEMCRHLLAEAKRRLDANPDAYVPKVYGETEAGGTQVLYLSHVDFEKLGLPAYGDQGVPHVAYSVQEGIYKGFIAPVALYTALGLVMLRNRKKQGDSGEPGEGVTS